MLRRILEGSHAGQPGHIVLRNSLIPKLSQSLVSRVQACGWNFIQLFVDIGIQIAWVLVAAAASLRCIFGRGDTLVLVVEGEVASQEEKAELSASHDRILFQEGWVVGKGLLYPEARHCWGRLWWMLRHGPCESGSLPVVSGSSGTTHRRIHSSIVVSIDFSSSEGITVGGLVAFIPRRGGVRQGSWHAPARKPHKQAATCPQ